jgi:hypothetical protein
MGEHVVAIEIARRNGITELEAKVRSRPLSIRPKSVAIGRAASQRLRERSVIRTG